MGKDDSALAWLVSFLNCGQRISSRDENYLFLGANCSEDCEAIRRFVIKLSQDITEIEQKTFSISVDDEMCDVSFSFEMFPNDMQYVTFLSGELSISPTFFSPFANVTKDEICALSPLLGLTLPKNGCHGLIKKGSRLHLLLLKKQELSGSSIKPSSLRNKITTFIAKKGSQSEFPPLLGKVIDRVKAGPLHLKNNAWQQWHALILKYAVARSDVGGCESACDTPASSCFRQYYEALECVLKATRLAKKVRKWFCEGHLVP